MKQFDAYKDNYCSLMFFSVENSADVDKSVVSLIMSFIFAKLIEFLLKC